MISREAPLSVFDIVYVRSSLFVLFHLKVFCLYFRPSQNIIPIGLAPQIHIQNLF